MPERSPRFREFVLRRARWVSVAGALGVLLPAPLCLAPPDSDHTLWWLLDLAAHWQWLYIAGLLVGVAGAAWTARRWWLALPLAGLPWLTAAPVLPAGAATAATLSIAVANVHLDNSDAAPLAAWLAREQPDIVVVLEVSAGYALGLAELRGYPHRHIVPRDDPFGIAVLSRHPLRESLARRDAMGIPHLETRIDFQGREVALLAAHPMPPIAAAHHAERNRKLAGWAADLARGGLPGLVAGDLNATPWSMAFNGLGAAGLHRATSLVPTWPAALGGLMGIPIDHVLATSQWRLVAAHRGPNLGSDHTPVLVRVAIAAP
jgi:endonuclease/exonuclease/phosphatase (EEP) superfamily protein YafD